MLRQFAGLLSPSKKPTERPDPSNVNHSTSNSNSNSTQNGSAHNSPSTSPAKPRRKTSNVAHQKQNGSIRVNGADADGPEELNKNDHATQEWSKIAENYGEYYLSKEHETLEKFCPSGMYVIPSESNFLVWHGVFFVHSKLYKGAVLKFILYIDEEYPRKRPSVVFYSKVTHPLVDPMSGELNLSTRFPEWVANQDYIYHILTYIKEIFKKIPEQGHFNREISDLVSKDPEKFREKMKETVDLSISNLYDHHDSSPLRFSDLPTSDFEKYKHLMLSFNNEQAKTDEDYFEKLLDHFPDVEED